MPPADPDGCRAGIAAHGIDREAAAYRLFERLRWGGAPDCCPHCGEPGRCVFLAAADGRSRATRTGARSARRVWRCRACRRQFSVLTGTVFEGTRLPLTTWIDVVSALVEHELTGDGDPARSPAAVLRAGAGLGARTANAVAARWAAVCARTSLREDLSCSRADRG